MIIAESIYLLSWFFLLSLQLYSEHEVTNGRFLTKATFYVPRTYNFNCVIYSRDLATRFRERANVAIKFAVGGQPMKLLVSY